MSGQNGTVVNTNPADETGESESELGKQPFSSTENEQAFRGPKFSPPVYRRRYAAVCELAKEHQARKVLDFGCAEAKLVKALINQESLTHLEEVVGIDINRDLLEENKFRIKPFLGDYLRPRTHPFKVSLYQGSIGEVDGRFVDFDLIACVELIEHLEPDILSSMPEVVFGHLSPKVVIVTTPNVEFNVLFPGLKGFRHYDHKFEWTRAEFEEWCSSQASQYNYTVSFDGIAPGPQGTEHLGCCSQVAVFKRISSSVSPEKLLQTCQPYNLVAEVEFPFKRDTRTEKEKILHEVEYVLWVLSSKEEEEEEEGSDESRPSDEDVIELVSNDEGNNELTSSNDDDDKPTPSDEDVIELVSNDKGNNELTSSNDDDDKPTPSDEDVIELTSNDEGNNELTSSNDGDDKPTISDDGVIKMTPNDEHNNKLTPNNDGNDERTAYCGGVIEWTLNDEDNNELTPSNSGDDQQTPSEHNDNELSSSSSHSDKQSPKDNDVMAEELQGFNDYSKSIDGVEERIYSLEKLLAFPSLHKLCGDDIQKLK
ncbi:unnamed protein product [Porites evermanni]|uniref:Small RNA 2'-O-methyltransferase n=1 Tax=Porites evermanni TaxID=104178 RepID=A0ABN8M7S2_9CNID|nr:unnamed protein product [Porites evermanni]